MKRLAVVAIFFTLAGNAAWAEGENCRKSREYLCTAATVMPNIRDAYVLKDGGIAVVAKQDSVAATAATLARFCDDYPRATLRFLARKELLLAKSVASIVQISSTSSTPCKKIKGLS